MPLSPPLPSPPLCPSGLDAASAYHVMAIIRRLAEQGRTIVTVIHQPSSEVFDLFDKLSLLSGGKVVYFGECSRSSSGTMWLRSRVDKCDQHR